MKLGIYDVFAGMMMLMQGICLAADDDVTVLAPVLGLPREINCYIDDFAAQQTHFNPSLNLVAKNAEAMCQGSVNKLALLFELTDKIDIPYGRSIITYMVGSFIDGINAQPEKFRSYFTTFPLELDDVVMSIRMRSPPGCVAYPALGNVASITSMDGLIIYGTLNSYTYEIDSLRIERYSQAVKLATGS